MWSDILYKDNNHFIQDLPVNKDPENLTNLIAEGLSSSILSTISHKGLAFWNEYSTAIPEKFLKLNFLIRPFENFCRTCIITDEEIELFVRLDLERFGNEVPNLFRELNFLIPVQLKKAGFEIIRPEEVTEISRNTVRKLARAIHSRYLREMRTANHSALEYTGDFDDLPEEIKFSNFDNAFHIPAKLLAIGYKIRQVRKGYKPVALHLNQEEIETMAKVEHLRWSWEKRLSGWTFGSKKDDFKKTHPSLIPYSELSEAEKEKDRDLVKLIPALLQDIDYEIYPISPNRIRKLSYAIKSQGIIQKILDETREINEQIRKLVPLTPDLEAMVTARNKKIEEAIDEIEGSYNYARHIQETFLPDDLYIRECFPESFILFKPKDIVSGDFYFFSKQNDIIIFAAADCTGHGIPGALLSTLGYGILDQAVNEIRLTDPSYILYHLYSRIHRFLRNESEEEGLSDDMDIILCILDVNTNILTYAGVKNPIYHITTGELVEYSANNSQEACNNDGECLFKSDSVQLLHGDTIYLCSDGYVDQFGGKNHKKFQSVRLKKLLKSVYNFPMPEQSDLLYEEFEQWRGENQEEQTDDILVIGIRI